MLRMIRWCHSRLPLPIATPDFPSRLPLLIAPPDFPFRLPLPIGTMHPEPEHFFNPPFAPRSEMDFEPEGPHRCTTHTAFHRKVAGKLQDWIQGDSEEQRDWRYHRQEVLYEYELLRENHDELRRQCIHDRNFMLNLLDKEYDENERLRRALRVCRMTAFTLGVALVVVCVAGPDAFGFGLR